MSEKGYIILARRASISRRGLYMRRISGNAGSIGTTKDRSQMQIKSIDIISINYNNIYNEGIITT